jgi:hypothetical protein
VQEPGDSASIKPGTTALVKEKEFKVPPLFAKGRLGGVKIVNL